MKFKDFSFEFKNYLLNEKALSRETTEYYLKDLVVFFKTLEDKSILEVNEEDFEKYILISLSKYKKNTVLRKLSTVKVFFDYLFLKKMIDKVLDIDKNVIYSFNNKNEILKVDEFRNLIHEIKENTFENIRDKLFIKVLFYTDAKISEILNIKFEDFLNEKFLILGGTKIISVDKELIEDIKFYKENIRIKYIDEEKNKFLFQGLNRNKFLKRLKSYSKKAGINKNLSSKTLKNTFKYNLNKSELKKILGIKEIKEENLKNLYNKIKIGD